MQNILLQCRVVQKTWLKLQNMNLWKPITNLIFLIVSDLWYSKPFSPTDISKKWRSFTANPAFSTLPSSQPSSSYLHTVHLSSCCLSPDIFFSRELSSRLSFLLEHPSAGSSFLASGPVFLAQHFYFVCPFFTLNPSPYSHLKRFQSFLLIPS